MRVLLLEPVGCSKKREEEEERPIVLSLSNGSLGICSGVPWYRVLPSRREVPSISAAVAVPVVVSAALPVQLRV